MKMCGAHKDSQTPCNNSATPPPRVRGSQVGNHWLKKCDFDRFGDWEDCLLQQFDIWTDKHEQQFKSINFAKQMFKLCYAKSSN